MNNTSPLGAIRRRWWVIVLLAITGGVLGGLPNTERVEDSVLTKTFSATHTMLVNNTDSLSDSRVSPSQVSLFATVGDVPQRVADAIDYAGNAAELANEISIQFDGSTGALTFTTEQDSAGRAELIADTFAVITNAYLLERQSDLYQQQVATSSGRLAELDEELTTLGSRLAASPDDAALKAERDAISREYGTAFEQNRSLLQSAPALGFTTLQSAQAVEVTSSHGGGISAPTSRRVRSLMGLVAGASVGVGIALLLGRVDRKIRTREQAEEVLGIRARVSVPKVADNNQGGLVAVTGRHDQLSDSYRTLRNVVSFVQSGLEPLDRAPVTLVVSPGPGDGKTALAANLAAAFVETGDHTIIVNTDYRRPRLVNAVRKDPVAPHPFEYEDLERVEPAMLLFDTDLSDMQLLDLCTIDATPGELARAAARLTPGLAGLADQVVIDSSPVGATAEVLDLVPYADAIVIVVKVGYTRIEAATRTISVLRDLTTAPILLALTGTKQARASYYDYTDRRRPARTDGDSEANGEGEAHGNGKGNSEDDGDSTTSGTGKANGKGDGTSAAELRRRLLRRLHQPV